MPKERYTLLVVNRGPTPGTVSAAQIGRGTWGRKEGPPTFRLVPIMATEEEIQWLRQHGRYDPGAARFRDKATGEPFDPAVDIVEATDFDQDLERCRLLAIELNGGRKPPGPPCQFLRPRYLAADEDERQHFLRLFWPHRRLPGVLALLRAAKRGLFPDVRAGLRALPEATATAILESWPEADREYFLWLRGEV